MMITIALGHSLHPKECLSHEMGPKELLFQCITTESIPQVIQRDSKSFMMYELYKKELDAQGKDETRT